MDIRNSTSILDDNSKTSMNDSLNATEKLQQNTNGSGESHAQKNISDKPLNQIPITVNLAIDNSKEDADSETIITEYTWN